MGLSPAPSEDVSEPLGLLHVLLAATCCKQEGTLKTSGRELVNVQNKRYNLDA